jgi:hypothetical protein
MDGRWMVDGRRQMLDDIRWQMADVNRKQIANRYHICIVESREGGSTVSSEQRGSSEQCVTEQCTRLPLTYRSIDTHYPPVLKRTPGQNVHEVFNNGVIPRRILPYRVRHAPLLFVPVKDLLHCWARESVGGDACSTVFCVVDVGWKIDYELGISPKQFDWHGVHQ